MITSLMLYISVEELLYRMFFLCMTAESLWLFRLYNLDLD